MSYVQGEDKRKYTYKEITFMSKEDENTVQLYWQKRKHKLAAVRYQNPVLKRMEGYEVFVDEDVLNGSNLWFDDVIWIKNGGSLFDGGGKLLNGIIDTLLHDYGLDTQYVGVGKDIWLGVFDEDNLNDAIDYYDELYSTNEKSQNHKNKLALACQQAEKLVQRAYPEASVSAKACEKKYLLGKFVLEICDLDKFTVPF